MRTVLMITRENNVAGNRRHGAIYPMFSQYSFERGESTDSENMERVLYRKITVEDGTFSSSGRFGYTGQHTDLDCIDLPGYEDVKVIRNAPRYITGTLFSRNKYGATKRAFRLDLEREVVQYQRNEKWYDFSPARYID